MNRISDDDDLRNAITIWGLVDTIPDSKKFHFGTGNVNHMVGSLDDGTIVGMHMRNRYSNVVFNAGIYNYNGSKREDWRLHNHIVKLLRAKFIIFLFIMYVKYELI